MRTFFQLVDAIGARTTLPERDYERAVTNKETRAALEDAKLVEWSDAALTTIRVVPSAIGKVLASLYGVDARVAAPLAASVADAAPHDPIHLGVVTGEDGARDVFWIRSPNADALKDFVVERGRAPRATTLLVPTTRGLPVDWTTRWSANLVEVEILAESILVRNAQLTLASRLRVVRVAPGAAADIPLATPVNQSRSTRPPLLAWSRRKP